MLAALDPTRPAFSHAGNNAGQEHRNQGRGGPHPKGNPSRECLPNPRENVPDRGRLLPGRRLLVALTYTGFALPPVVVGLFVYILLFTMAFGVLWEVLEYSARFVTDFVGVEAVLIQFSVEDTIVDLMFDFVGAVLVALFGTPRLQSLVGTLTDRLDRAGTG